MFGITSFISAQPSRRGVKTKEMVEVAYIEKGPFMKLIKKYPEDYERFLMLKDNYNMN